MRTIRTMRKILISIFAILTIFSACRKPLPPQKDQKKEYYIYYRIKTIDKDGKVSYSTQKIVSIEK